VIASSPPRFTPQGMQPLSSSWSSIGTVWPEPDQLSPWGGFCSMATYAVSAVFIGGVLVQRDG
jgi:hypothetical protein